MRLKERVGKFYVDMDIIYNHPHKVQLIMGWMVIIRAEMRMDKMAMEYYAYSPLFIRGNSMGCEPYTYEIEVTKSNQVIATLNDDLVSTHEIKPYLKSDLQVEIDELAESPIGRRALEIATDIICKNFFEEDEEVTGPDSVDNGQMLKWPHGGPPLDELTKDHFKYTYNNLDLFNHEGILGPNDFMQEDGTIVKICPICGHKEDRTFTYCEKCEYEF